MIRSTAAEWIAGVSQVRLWWLMGWRDIALKYRRSMIGPFWITFTLVFFAFAMGLLYGQVFNQPFTEYVTFLVCGLAVWYIIQGFFLEGSTMVSDVEGIIANVPINLATISARVVVRTLITFAHNFLACVFVLVVLGIGFSWSVVYLLPAILVYVVFGFGLCFLLGPVSARYRDIPQLVGAVMQLALFLSPIVWPPSLIDPASPAIRFNPLHHLVEIGRAPLLGHAPSTENWTIACVTALSVLFLGFFTYAGVRNRIFYWI